MREYTEMLYLEGIITEKQRDDILKRISIKEDAKARFIDNLDNDEDIFGFGGQG